MFGYRDPMRDRNSIVGGNGMATMGKSIFYVLGGIFLLGILGKAAIVLVLICGLVYLNKKKTPKFKENPLRKQRLSVKSLEKHDEITNMLAMKVYN